MTKDSKQFRVIGVIHVATPNDFTVRVRIILKDAAGKVYSFDGDSCVWDLEKWGIKECPEMHKIIGTAT